MVEGGPILIVLKRWPENKDIEGNRNPKRTASIYIEENVSKQML